MSRSASRSVRQTDLGTTADVEVTVRDGNTTLQLQLSLEVLTRQQYAGRVILAARGVDGKHIVRLSIDMDLLVDVPEVPQEITLGQLFRAAEDRVLARHQL